MCDNCRGREHPTAGPSVPGEDSISTDSDLAARLSRPISRAQLLRGAGAGLGLALAGSSLRLGSAIASQDTRSELPYLALIVLDGARPDYFDVPGIPRVRELMRNGTRYTNAFAGILESETPSGHTSIATGSDPRANGILSFWWANSDNVQVDLFSPDKIRAGDMEAIVRRSRVPTIAGRVHATRSNAKVVALSGSKYYAADAIGGPDADIIMYFYGTTNGMFVPTYIPGHAPPAAVLRAPHLTTANKHIPLGVENHLAMQLAIETFQHTHQQVSLINLPEFDWPLGHVDGGILDSHAVTSLMQSFDQDLAMLQAAYHQAGVLDRTIFVLMADHGMMPLMHKVAAPDLAGAITKAGTTIISQSYSSGAYFWVKDQARAGQAAKNIGALDHPYIQSVYIKTTTKQGPRYVRVTSGSMLDVSGTEGANQYLLGTFAGANGPDIVVLFAEHVGSEPGGQAGWKADHGGASWQAQHIPLILSGPGIRAGHVSSLPARLIDVAPTVLHAMGATYGGMQGIVLADALRNPPASAIRRQQATRKQLLPVVEALRRESKRETAAKR